MESGSSVPFKTDSIKIYKCFTRMGMKSLLLLVVGLVVVGAFVVAFSVQDSSDGFDSKRSTTTTWDKAVAVEKTITLEKSSPGPFPTDEEIAEAHELLDVREVGE